MDPRTSATVTAPDLLKAFAEGTGRDEEGSGGEELFIWVAYGNGDKVTYTNFTLSITGLSEAMNLATGYLRDEGQTVIMVVSKERPAAFQTAISAADD